MKLHTLIRDLSSEDYHATPNTISSSQFKDILVDEEVFYNKHVAKTVERVSIPAFDVGTYFHTGVLEPHKLKVDCAVFQGKIRRGREWEKFKLKNKNRAIVTPAEMRQAEGLVRAVKESPVAMSYLAKGEPEVSMFVELLIHDGEIYVPKFFLILTRDGWKKTNKGIPAKAGIRIVVKVRADMLGKHFILDLKSTTGNVKNEYEMRSKISSLCYDLSASLYLDIFTAGLNRADNPYKKFIWTFASKDNFNSCSYLASPNNVLVGRAKWRKGVLKYAKMTERKWQFEDTLRVIEPQSYELEHIRESDESDCL